MDRARYSPFGLESSNRSKAQQTDTQVCAANSLAAMVPAMAGVGRCANNRAGTTSSPTVVRLPHHKAAARNEAPCHSPCPHT